MPLWPPKKEDGTTRGTNPLQSQKALCGRSKAACTVIPWSNGSSEVHGDCPVFRRGLLQELAWAEKSIFYNDFFNKRKKRMAVLSLSYNYCLIYVVMMKISSRNAIIVVRRIDELGAFGVYI
jgi:hypothetical protein